MENGEEVKTKIQNKPSVALDFIRQKQHNYSNLSTNLTVICLGRIGEFRSQQVDHRRDLLMIPRSRQLLHNSLNLQGQT